MIIDAHTHLGNFNQHNTTVADLVESMKDAQIDLSLVIANSFSEKMGGISTKDLLSISKTHPQLRIIGEVNIQTWGDEQRNTLQEQLQKKEIYGVKLYPGYQNYYPYDERFHSLFSFCENEGFPIIIHTGFLEINSPGSMKQPHPIHVDDIAQKYPNLKIVMAHMGYPWVTDCAVVIYRNKNVYGDFSAMFTEYLPISEEETRSFIAAMQSFKTILGDYKKCLFGTDFPLYSQKDYLAAAEKLELSEEEKELVFSKNALSLFNLEK